MRRRRVINVAGFDWVDPVEDAALIDHLTEIAVIIALFSAGLKLDRPLTPRAWGTTARLLLLAMPLTIGLVALLGSLLLGLSAAAALLLGAILAPTDPVLAGDIGVGPPGDEDEHEPNFALTSEAGLNDGLAFPFVLAALAMAAEDGRGWIGEWLAADVLYGIAGGLAIGAAVGIVAAWSVKRLRDHDLLAPAFDQYHALATVLVIYGLAEAAGTYGFLAAFAGGLAFRRYEKDHEINARVHEGAELAEKLLELSVILLLGSMLGAHGAGGAGLGGMAARGAPAGRGAAARVHRRALGLQARRPGGEVVRRVVRRPRRRLALLHGDRGGGRRARPRRAGPRGLDRDRRRPHLDRGPRHHGRAVDAPPAQAAASCSTAGESASSLSRSSTARSSAGWWMGSSPGSSASVTRSSAGRIVSPALKASNTRGSM